MKRSKRFEHIRIVYSVPSFFGSRVRKKDVSRMLGSVVDTDGKTLKVKWDDGGFTIVKPNDVEWSVFVSDLPKSIL